MGHDTTLFGNHEFWHFARMYHSLLPPMKISLALNFIDGKQHYISLPTQRKIHENACTLMTYVLVN